MVKNKASCIVRFPLSKIFSEKAKERVNSMALPDSHYVSLKMTLLRSAGTPYLWSVWTSSAGICPAATSCEGPSRVSQTDRFHPLPMRWCREAAPSGNEVVRDQRPHGGAVPPRGDTERSRNLWTGEGARAGHGLCSRPDLGRPDSRAARNQRVLPFRRAVCDVQPWQPGQT